MAKGPVDLFEEQYGGGRLTYSRTLPRLRRWFRPWIRDRFDVTREALEHVYTKGHVRRVLDFGCGDGRLARVAADAAPDTLTEIVGVDISPSRVAQAQGLTLPRPNGKPGFRFVAGDESALESVREDGFDLVLCIAVFGQVYDLYGLGRSLLEVLRPGGYLIAEFANYAYVRHRLRSLLGRIPTISPAPMDLWRSIGWDSGELHYFSRSTSVRFIEQVGFVVEGVHPTGLVATLLPVWPSLLATGFVIVARRPG